MEEKTKEEISTILNEIASIQTGQTFSPLTNKPTDHGTWSSSVYRRYYGEDRGSMLTYLKQVYTRAFELNIDTNYTIIGLEYLQKTYAYDFVIVGMIETLIQQIRNQVLIIPPHVYDLFDAVKEQNQTWIETYLYEGRDIGVKNNEGQNALHLAAQQRYYDKNIINLLIHFNIDAQLHDNDRNTPLYYAITSGCTQAVLMIEEALAIQRKKEIV
ncbi:MAG TPA: ankyrin repeat domain-containing protein [Candidatus Saccharimonadales bacterium]|nr:ankyrin repeat domain-containing protein [Candidatus Saccharimonadales bacterium]